MLTQSIHFEITGQDAHYFLKACQERGIEPMQALQSFLLEFTSRENKKSQEDKLRAKKMAYAGSLSHLADPQLRALEDKAVEMAIKEKYNVD